METIERDGITFAILVHTKSHQIDGTEFFTPKDCTLQMGVMRRPGRYVEPAHYHKQKERQVACTYETVFVTRGTVTVDFFPSTNASLPFLSIDVKRGDLIMLLDGPHRIRTKTGFVAVKVKQGPYVNLEEDKVVLSP